MIPETGAVDVPGLRKLLQYHVESKTDNLCILGTTGEASVMTHEERDLILKVAVEEVKGTLPILAGTGTINPVHVKEMTQHARDVGCDAALIVTPYYVKPPQRGLIHHFVTAADQYGLPVVMYNVPGRTAVDLQDETAAVCAQHSNIVGLKDATGDVSRLTNMKQLLARDGSDMFLYSGDDSTSLDFLLAGGDGCISVTANVAAERMHNWVRACLEGDFDKAKELHEPLKLLHPKLFVESNPIAAKWAVARMGMIDSAYCRPPLDSLNPDLESTVEDALRQAELL
jgi:4-hydroxy-tetrahydrodipicolinate synthase